MVPDYLVDNEPQEFLGEFRVEMRFLCQFTQALYLQFLSRRIGWRERDLRLIPAHRLRDAEALGQYMDQRSVDIVDAFAVARQHRIVGWARRGIVW